MSTRYYVGPCGGTGGANEYTITPPADGLVPKEIQIYAGAQIDAIEVIWRNGTSSQKCGGSGGIEKQFEIDDGDYLARIEGSLGLDRHGYLVVSSLQLFTKKGKHSEPYGNETTAKFHFPALPGYQITGFFGRYGVLIDSLGIILESAPSQA